MLKCVQQAMLRFAIGACLFLTTAHDLSAKVAKRRAGAWALGSLVNTSYNTSYQDGRWVATMGPLTNYFGGIACDHRAHAEGDDQKFRKGDYAVWFIAPSDALKVLGMNDCASNPNGGEPSCEESWNLCGRKIRIRCRQGDEYCAEPGSPSLLADINNGKIPKNNYLPDYYRQRTEERVGTHPSAPRSVILYITDFCPKNHSINQQTGQCQGPQIDVSASAFLMLARQSSGGYINSNMDYYTEILDEYDPTPAGPEWTLKHPYPYCTAANGRGFGDTWQADEWTLAKNSPDLQESSICVVAFG